MRVLMAEKLSSESVVGMGSFEDVDEEVKDEDELLYDILILSWW